MASAGTPWMKQKLGDTIIEDPNAPRMGRPSYIVSDDTCTPRYSGSPGNKILALTGIQRYPDIF